MIDIESVMLFLCLLGPPTITFFLGAYWTYSRAIRFEADTFGLIVAVIGVGIFFGLLGLIVSFTLIWMFEGRLVYLL